jgi:1-acyl-sn-glycerol-3-phosphate acyltransferase
MKTKNINWLIVIPRAIVAAALLSVYFLVSMPLGFFVRFSPFTMRKILNQVVSFFCGLMTRVLGIKITVIGDTVEFKNNNYLIVANHLSYTDIFPLYWKFPACFVTSNEMRETPFLGQVAEAAACLFVERRNRHNIQKEVQNLTNGLKNGLNVFVFPEATSHNGEKVHMFRKTMFNGVLYSQKPVLPLTLNYKKLSGRTITLENRDEIFWYGDSGFYPHILSVLTQTSIELEISVHAPITDVLNKTDIELANMAQAIVEKKYQPIV